MPKRKTCNRSNLGSYKLPSSTPAASEPLGDKCVYLHGKALLETLQNTHPCCKKNKTDCLKLIEMVNERQGIMRSLRVICSKCSLDIYVDDPTRTNTTFWEGLQPNTTVTFASDVAGIDFEQLKLFCSILNIPGPPDSYDSLHQTQIHERLKQYVDRLLEANRKEALENAIVTTIY